MKNDKLLFSFYVQKFQHYEVYLSIKKKKKGRGEKLSPTV